MPKFRKKPVVIEAVQFLGTNIEEVRTFIADGAGAAMSKADSIAIETPDGIMYAAVGDYVIRDVKGEFYPCKLDIFEATYECVDAEDSSPRADQ